MTGSTNLRERAVVQPRHPVIHLQRPAAPKASIAERWTLAGCLMALILASDYKFRVREVGAAVSGGIDAAIILEIAVYGVVAVALVARRKRAPHVRRLARPTAIAVGYVGLMVVSVLYAAFPPYAIVRAGQMCVLLAITLEAGSSGDRAHFHRFAHLYLVTVMLSVGYGHVVPSPPLNRLQEGRFTWLAIHPTVSGVLTGLAALVAISYSTWGDRPRPGPAWPRLAYVASLAFTVYAVLAVHTRGAVLGMAAGALVLMLFALRGRQRLQVFGLVIVAATFVVMLASNLVVSYFVRDESVESISTLNSRTDYWAVALESVERDPLFGYGVGSARGLFVEDTGLGGGHNAIVNVLVELGLVGAMTWAALVIATALCAIRARRTGPSDVIIDRAMVLSFLAFLIVDGMFYDGPGGAANVGATWLFVCVGWVAAMLEPQLRQRFAARRSRPGVPDLAARSSSVSP